MTSPLAPSSSRPDEPVLEAQGVVREYRGGDGAVLRVLAGVDLSVRAGEMVAIVGASGAGKSTLLQVLGALDSATAGTVRIGGREVPASDDIAMAALRNRAVGFVFQFHHLLAEFSAVENVAMPLLISGRAPAAAQARATALLAQVGLAARTAHRPGELSGGEQQRVAVARALAADPAVLLADEPSGNLDHQTAEQLHEMLAALVAGSGLALVVVTHNASLAARAHRVLVLEDGVLRPMPETA
ncbi:MAG: ABC transporter ATP-binding protein [Gemmatimonadota bacterium]|nr:ABC transporter ATP-binding protein [Gemmatimonadota bacterium]MDQ8146438.1 ABC transporter ATP-binding protein [Gemmatimonadota bacterium]MDQ8148365.1 ABC transporter ATP-binding protein [Gemmatimonadota bacterium]MDQ8156171.1 ABC transporter ATP-binding protein [Gemmatimonadota bacterium]MDQ8176156.1 ABC transporter ATP-binding protein [Gemmatimonadota bacterium]